MASETAGEAEPGNQEFGRRRSKRGNGRKTGRAAGGGVGGRRRDVAGGEMGGTPELGNAVMGRTRI